MRPPLWARRLLRPLVPDRWMARRRLHDHSRFARHNVDVVVAGATRASLWLDTTPDTFRVRDPGSFGPGPDLRAIDGAATDVEGDEAVLVAGTQLSAELTGRLAGPLADPEIAAVVLAEVAEPRLVERRRVEPAVAPAAIAVRGTAWREVGGTPAGPSPLPGLLERLRDAGHRLAVIPATRAGSPQRRSDPIAGPATVVLSLVPLHDVGGGSRSAQLALGLLRRGHHVTVVAVQESTDADLGLRFIHPRLEQRTIAGFDPYRYLGRVRGDPPLVIAAAPEPNVCQLAMDLQAGGAGLVYDCIDDWSSPWLGGDWYDEEAERALAAAAQVVVAAAPDLVDRMAAVFGKDAVLVPNGVDEEAFGKAQGPPPADLPPGDGPVLGFHGTLRAPWIDWPAVAAVAEAYPDARLVLIGEAPDPLPPLPGNVAFIGLKPHGELAGYLSRFRVGLVPFVLDPATHAASPLKVYEYLAAGVPVAAPPLRSLLGLDGVATDPDLPAAVAAALSAPRPNAAAARATHSWSGRLAALLVAAGRPVLPPDAPSALVVRRPAIHYAKHQRRMPPSPTALPAASAREGPEGE